MRKLVNNIILIFLFTIIIILSYALIQKKISDLNPHTIFEFFKHRTDDGDPDDDKDEITGKYEDQIPYRAIWLSYLEFDSYRRSVSVNDEKHFSEFFRHIIEKCKKAHINHIIVHVRPFGDALYKSSYFPWASCISGEQGTSPGYDPLAVMIKLAHANDMKLEAWINPYRISSGDDIKELSKDNPARKWAEEGAASRNVLTYDHSLYYNPASKQVRSLIQNGVQEIVSNYKVDGIHMDDYFYPCFDESDYDTAFDSREYKNAAENGTITKSMSLPEWRRYNVNQLVSGIYRTVKKADHNITFGISPAGDPDNLRSNYETYADIDTWLSKDGYIDYIMPQIYWGYTNTEAPFNDILIKWKKLCRKSNARLYIGIQLYRMGSDEKSLSDYEELQSADLIRKQLEQLRKDSFIPGYCLFSYQYIDSDNETYMFDSFEFSKKRKTILKEIWEYLKSQ